MGKVAVGEHHFIRSYLPALIGVLLGAALVLVGLSAVMQKRAEVVARAMAQRGAPGHQIQLELELAVGQLAVAGVLSANTGDDRILDEARGRLDSAARAYDGFVRAAHVSGVQPVTAAIRRYQDRIEVAVDGGADLHGKTPLRDHIDAHEIEAALVDMSDVMRDNRHALVADTTAMLDRMARCQQRRLYIEMGTMGVLVAGCIALLFAARRREEKCCFDEQSEMRKLEQTNADLEAFAGRVAHDLRNPLVPILSGSQVIERADVDVPVRRAAERIERSARRIAALIDMLLEFSKLASARKPVETEVAPLLDEVVDAFGEKARAVGVRLQVSCTPDLRALAEPIVIASPLQNLVENAFKYGRRDDGSEPVIDVRGYWRAGMVILEVEDRGPGISPQTAETLFRAFARGQGGGEGVGLGLATARRLVESRGGSIGLRAGQYGGALFQVRLPSPRAPEGVQLAPAALGGTVPA